MSTLLEVLKLPWTLLKALRSIAHAIRTGDWSEGRD